jgi:hypothetical protein
MNVEIGAEAALFPEKQYISGIFIAVWQALVARVWDTFSKIWDTFRVKFGIH